MQGSGSGLMCRANKFHTMVKSMVSVLGGYGKPFTVKMRKGVTMDKNIAHNFVSYCRDSGVSLVTVCDPKLNIILKLAICIM